ncbi:MAG: hypothetical protein AAGF45_09780, partial [Pseudomonadota bacterium]
MVRAIALGTVALALSACIGGTNLGRDAFVGDWACEGTPVTLTVSAIQRDGAEEKIAWIETGKNADFGLFTTMGDRY